MARKNGDISATGCSRCHGPTIYLSALGRHICMAYGVCGMATTPRATVEAWLAAGPKPARRHVQDCEALTGSGPCDCFRGPMAR